MKKIFANVYSLCKSFFIFRIFALALLIILLEIIKDKKGIDYFALRYFLLIFMVGISVTYIMSSMIHKLNRRIEGNRVALFFRSILNRICFLTIFIWIKILLKSFGIMVPDEFEQIFIFVLSYSLIFSLLAIMMGLKTSTLIFIFIIIIPLILLLGVFDIKWWALITGLLSFWNYINSSKFLIFLRKGQEPKEIPKELKYKWESNKFRGYVVTIMFYASLVFSSFFEIKSPNTFFDYLSNGQKRVYSLIGVLVFTFMLLVILGSYYYILNKVNEKSRFEQLLLKIGRKIGLNSFNSTIKIYIKAKKGELK